MMLHYADGFLMLIVLVKLHSLNHRWYYFYTNALKKNRKPLSVKTKPKTYGGFRIFLFDS